MVTPWRSFINYRWFYLGFLPIKGNQKICFQANVNKRSNTTHSLSLLDQWSARLLFTAITLRWISLDGSALDVPVVWPIVVCKHITSIFKNWKIK